MPPARGGRTPTGLHGGGRGVGPAPTPLRPRPGRRRSGAPPPGGATRCKAGRFSTRRQAAGGAGPDPPAASTRTKAALALAGDLGSATEVSSDP